MLNPEGSHFQGNTYLKIFVNEVLEIEDYLLIIEMKIDAGDQENQLKRYNNYGLKSGKEFRIYYLTLFGNEASDFSTDNEDFDYTCISFETDILNWINECIRAYKTPLLPVIRETLVQYSKLLEKLTNQLDGGLKMDIKDLLLKENNLYIAQQIEKAIPYCRAELEYKFWKELCSKCNKEIEKLGIEYFDDGFFEDEKRILQWWLS